jgi:hypothetical protein
MKLPLQQFPEDGRSVAVCGVGLAVRGTNGSEIAALLDRGVLDGDHQH